MLAAYETAPPPSEVTHIKFDGAIRPYAAMLRLI